MTKSEIAKKFCESMDAAILDVYAFRDGRADPAEDYKRINEFTDARNSMRSLIYGAANAATGAHRDFSFRERGKFDKCERFTCCEGARVFATFCIDTKRGEPFNTQILIAIDPPDNFYPRPEAALKILKKLDRTAALTADGLEAWITYKSGEART